MEGATGTVDAVVGPGSTLVSIKLRTNHVCFLSDPGIPGVRSMGRECLSLTEGGL